MATLRNKRSLTEEQKEHLSEAIMSLSIEEMEEIISLLEISIYSDDRSVIEKLDDIDFSKITVAGIQNVIKQIKIEIQSRYTEAEEYFD